jgi:hypothetical protein
MTSALVETKDGMKISLNGLGEGLEGGFEGAADSLGKGLKSFAEEQVKVLNGLIEFFTTLVALSEGFEGENGDKIKLDLFGKDGILNEDDLFEGESLTQQFIAYIDKLSKETVDALNKFKIKVNGVEMGLGTALKKAVTAKEDELKDYI